MLAVTAGLLSGLHRTTASALTSQDQLRPASAHGSEPAIPSSASTFRIVAFGSSSTEGVGASSPAKAYPAQLEQLFARTYGSRPLVSIVNRGIGGQDIDDMVKRLRSDVLSLRPDLVIWQVGSNDPLRGVPIARFRAELTQGIDTIRAAGAEVMLMEPQWCPAIAAADTSGTFVEAVRSAGRQQDVPVIQRDQLMRRWLDQGLLTQHDLIGPDGLHMTDRGYSLLAKAVFDQIAASSAIFQSRAASIKSAGHS